VASSAELRACALVIALGLASIAGLVGCSSLRSGTGAELRVMVQREIEGDNTPSLVVVAVRDGEVVALAAEGMGDLAAGRAATVDTVYMLFSLSKPVTATAVVQLHDRGLIDIDMPAVAYLPDLTRYPGLGGVTIRHLLVHSSGLPNPSPFEWARPLGQPRPPLASFLSQVLDEHGHLHFEPGSGSQYSNVGYLILGRIVEHVSGRPFEVYVRENIFEPLRMERTSFAYERRLFDDVATGYVRAGTMQHALGRFLAGPAAFGRRIGDWVSGHLYVVDGAPYGGMVGTGQDLARFAAMHLGGGSYRGARVLSSEAVRMMQEEQRTTQGCLLPFSLGWHVGTVDGTRYFEHLGSGGGFRPALRLYPELDYGIVVLTNRTRYDPTPFTHTILSARPSMRREPQM
jgi:CubicO group peptidase (beta-lactamase class C family)